MSACKSCAFRPGSVTHDQEPNNLLKGLICAAAGVPFFCHHGFDWKNASVSLVAGRFVAVGGDFEPANVRVCEGWKEQVRRYRSAGYFSVTPDVRKLQIHLAAIALDSMRQYIDLPDGEDKCRALETLTTAAEILFKQPGGADGTP